MRVVKCTKCGKYIHKTSQCFHCGNTAGFDEIEMSAVHENVIDEYPRVESLVENKRFTEAITLSHVVLEWMPNHAGIFWLRLLAKNKCISALELIGKGFSCEEDADFCNALAFSEGEEHSTYVDIQNVLNSARKALKEEIIKHEYKCKAESNILAIKKNMQSEIDTRRHNLFSLWSDLEKTEQALYSIEIDCRLLLKEYSETLDKASQASAALKTETYKLEECTAEALHSYQVKIGNVLQQSEQAKDAIENMKKQHPWVKAFTELVTKRDKQIQLISAELSTLKSYEITIKQTLTEIERIEERHKKAIHEIENFDFRDAVVVLGRDCFNRVLHGVGICEDIQFSGPEQEWKVATEDIINSETEEESVEMNDDIDMDDYYNAWGLSNDNY